ncbi:MarR family winged helix-turn-helix transcriptional regulator [Longispora urticae]
MKTPAPRAATERAAVVEASLEQVIAVWSRPNDNAGVSASQLRALTVVERHNQINLTGLAEELGVIPSSASRLCDRLHAAGLLDRDLSPVTRREIVLRLTPDGTDLLVRLRSRRITALAEVLEAMEPSAQHALTEGLASLQAAVASRVSPNP